MVSPLLPTPDGGVVQIPADVVYILSGVAKLQYAITGNDMEFGPIVPETEEALSNADPVTAGMAEYYLPDMPGDVPNWKNSVSLLSLVPTLEWPERFDIADRFDATPVYVVYGAEATTKDGAIHFYDQLNGPKERLVLEGAGHFDIYWMPEYVDPAVDGISEFLLAIAEN
jgi:fermentation-respiration switch protein FrsA (DUF1100 family)